MPPSVASRVVFWAFHNTCTPCTEFDLALRQIFLWPSWESCWLPASLVLYTKEDSWFGWFDEFLHLLQTVLPSRVTVDLTKGLLFPRCSFVAQKFRQIFEWVLGEVHPFLRPSHSFPAVAPSSAQDLNALPQVVLDFGECWFLNLCRFTKSLLQPPQTAS